MDRKHGLWIMDYRLMSYDIAYIAWMVIKRGIRNGEMEKRGNMGSPHSD